MKEAMRMTIQQAQEELAVLAKEIPTLQQCVKVAEGTPRLKEELAAVLTQKGDLHAKINAAYQRTMSEIPLIEIEIETAK